MSGDISKIIEQVENALIMYGARAYYQPEHIKALLEIAKANKL